MAQIVIGQKHVIHDGDHQQCGVDAIQHATYSWQDASRILQMRVAFQHGLDQVAQHCDDGEDCAEQARSGVGQVAGEPSRNDLIEDKLGQEAAERAGQDSAERALERLVYLRTKASALPAFGSWPGRVPRVSPPT